MDRAAGKSRLSCGRLDQAFQGVAGGDRLFSKVSRVTESPKAGSHGGHDIRALRHPKGLPRTSRGQRDEALRREGTAVVRGVLQFGAKSSADCAVSPATGYAWRSASSGASAPSRSTCQKVQPLQAGAPCTAAPILWIEPWLAVHARSRRRRGRARVQRRFESVRKRARQRSCRSRPGCRRAAWAGGARGHHLHRAFVELQRRIDPLAGDVGHSASRARSRSSCRPSRRATAPVVPVPKKGSSTTSPLLVQASSTR